MKITHNKIGQNINLKDTQKSDQASQSGNVNKSSADLKTDLKANLNSELGSTQSGSKVDLSARAQQFQKAKQAALDAPDMQTDKIAKFKKMYQEGTYKVDADKVAEKMLQEHLDLSE